MGVLTGKLAGRLEKGLSEKALKEKEKFFKNLVKFSENYGVAIAEREVEARLENKKKKVFYY